MPSMKIRDLPPRVFRELCQYLNIDGLDGVRNWKDLAGLAGSYTHFDIAAFGRAGQRPNTNPAEQVLFDFIAQGILVNQLYRMLNEMDARECMNTLEEYVSADVIDDIREKRRAQEDARLADTLPDPIINDPADLAVPKDVHPLHGPLPPHPPPMHSSTPSHHHTVTVASSTSHVAVTPTPSSPGHTPSVFTASSFSTTSTMGVANGSGRRSPPFLFSNPHVPTADNDKQVRMLDFQRAAAINHVQQLQGLTPNDIQPNGTNYQPRITESSPIYMPPSYNGYYDNRLQWDSGTSSTNISVGSSTIPARPHPLPNNMGVVPSVGNSTHIDYSNSTIRGNSSSSSVPSSAASIKSSSDAVKDTAAPNILRFTYSELSEASEDFTKDIIGIGSFGTVFRAKIRGNGPFAIKKLHSEREMGGHMFYEAFHQETFAQELQLLTKYHHRNILSLVAYSNDGPRPCLVYEYMENGSLAECLQGRVLLPWRHRLNIANQIADALHFLHTVNKPHCLVHGDVKSANILLDAYLVPKLSDFGLARECQVKANQRSTYSTKSDIVMGTMAYMAPEFLRNKKLKPCTDVYSFGVVLLELYTGQPALSDDPSQRERVLTDRLSDLIEDSDSHQKEILTCADSQASWPAKTALELFDIVTVCLMHKPKQRPPMEQVIDQLQMIESPQ